METGEREGQPAAPAPLEADEMQKIRQIFERHHVPMTGKELVDDVLIPSGLSKDDARAILCAVNSYDGLDVSYQDLLNFILPEAATASSQAELHGPLVEETYDLEDPKSLAQYLINADVRLVRAPYLYKLLQSDRCMPRRQEAEHEFCEVNSVEVSALVSHEEVAQWASGDKKALICSVSHAWESMEHPDPCCFQLENLVNGVALYDAAYIEDIWLFYDYVSLFQFERHTDAQEQSFRRAMANMHMLYAHQNTLTLRLECLTPADSWASKEADASYKVLIYHKPTGAVKSVPLAELKRNDKFYRSRGWCLAEIEWSAARGVPSQNMAIDCYPDDKDTVMKVPTVPEEFEEKMAKSEFTHRDDAAIVVELQRKVFNEKVIARKQLRLEHLTKSDMARLAAALPHFNNLRVLDINFFTAHEAEAKAFCKALNFVRLQKLRISQELTDSTLQAMVEALPEIHVDAFASMTELDFSECDMSDRLAEVIAEVLKTNRTLTCINLRRTGTTDVGVQVIAEALKTNRTLTYIDLRSNHISYTGMEAIVDALQRNHTVTHIYFEETYFWTLCGKRGQALRQKLEGLLHVNRAAAEAPAATPAKQDQRPGDCEDAFSGHPRIQDLAKQLRDGGIGNAGGAMMTYIFFPNGWERKILGDDEVKALAEALQVNRRITDINLVNKGITDNKVKVIAHMLTKNKTIREIHLWRNQIGDAGLEALAEVLRRNRIITEINLHKNHIGEVGAKVLAEAVQENDTILDIDLHDNPLENTDAGRQALERIQERCRANQEAYAVAAVENLMELLLKIDGAIAGIDLESQWIRDAQFQALLEVLKIYQNITHIYIRRNRIGDAGAKVLAQELKHNRSIQWIDLTENQIGDAGVQVLAEALPENDTILDISLYGNPLENTDTGRQALERIQELCRAKQEAKAAAAAEKLMEDLKTDGAKLEINLQDQYIEDAQVQALSEVLTMNQSVTHIDLSCNRIKDAGAEVLAQVLRQNRTITWMSLSSNQIGEVGAEALAEALQENDTIMDLRLARPEWDTAMRYSNPLECTTAGCEALERIEERCRANRAAAEATIARCAASGHRLGPDARPHYLCSQCQRLGTQYRCAQELCDFDLCADCYESQAKDPSAR